MLHIAFAEAHCHDIFIILQNKSGFESRRSKLCLALFPSFDKRDCHHRGCIISANSRHSEIYPVEFPNFPVRCGFATTYCWGCICSSRTVPHTNALLFRCRDGTTCPFRTNFGKKNQEEPLKHELDTDPLSSCISISRENETPQIKTLLKHFSLVTLSTDYFNLPINSSCIENVAQQRFRQSGTLFQFSALKSDRILLHCSSEYA
jgi:hypothetical protein